MHPPLMPTIWTNDVPLEQASTTSPRLEYGRGELSISVDTPPEAPLLARWLKEALHSNVSQIKLSTPHAWVSFECLKSTPGLNPTWSLGLAGCQETHPLSLLAEKAVVLANLSKEPGLLR